MVFVTWRYCRIVYRPTLFAPPAAATFTVMSSVVARQTRRSRALRTIVVAASIALLSACDRGPVECAEHPQRLTAMSVVPQSVTVAPGDSAIVTAAAMPVREWTDCSGAMHPVRNLVTWSISNSAVATVTPLDSLRVRITVVCPRATPVIATAADVPDFKGAAAVVVP